MTRSYRPKLGDQVRFQMPVEGKSEGIVSHINGAYITVVVALGKKPENRIEIERYPEELTLVREGALVPWTQSRLERRIADAAPETMARQQRRLEAQLEIQRAVSAGDLKLRPDFTPELAR